MTSLPHPDPIRQTLPETDLADDPQAVLALQHVGVPELVAPRAEGQVVSDDGTQRYRPALRPATALLHVLDDNQQSAEVVRVRTASFVIGRTEGDLRLPHDRLISARHAQLVRQEGEEGVTWTLRDLRSSNGTFVRVRRAPLQHGSVVLLGRTRLRFELHGPPPPPSPVRETLDLGSIAAGGRPLAFLVELVPGGEGRRLAVTSPVQRLGRDAQQANIAWDDAALSPCHALIAMQQRGHWIIEDLDSFNGLWIRAATTRLAHGTSFLLGEQVFVFALP